MAGDGAVAPSPSPAGVVTSTSTWSVRVLETVAVERGGSRVALGGPQQRSALLRLVLAGGVPVAADALLHQLWPDHRPASATNTLQSYISTLRRQLRTPGSQHVIVREGSGYRCTIPLDAVDAFRFEQLLREAEDAHPEITSGCSAAVRMCGYMHGPVASRSRCRRCCGRRPPGVQRAGLAAAAHRAGAGRPAGDHRR